MSFISGTHRWLESWIRKLFNPWLVYNEYYDKGYRIVAEIPSPTIDKSDLYIKIHDSGNTAGTLLPNEKRALLRAALPQQAGIDISGSPPGGLSDLEAYATRTKPQAFNAQLQKVDTLANVMAANPGHPLSTA